MGFAFESERNERIHERLWLISSTEINPPQAKRLVGGQIDVAQKKYKSKELAHAHLVELDLKCRNLGEEFNFARVLMEPVQTTLLKVRYLHVRATRLAQAEDPFIKERPVEIRLLLERYWAAHSHAPTSDLLTLTANVFKGTAAGQTQSKGNGKDSEPKPLK